MKTQELQARQIQNARARANATADTRTKHKSDLKEKGVFGTDDPERVQKRVERLAAYYAPETSGGNPASALATSRRAFREKLEELRSHHTSEVFAVRTGLAIAGAEVQRDLEKVIGTADFLDVRYLEAGALAARSVCRVRIHEPEEGEVGSGTGFLVSPQLLLTNHHVLPTADIAAISKAEFNYEDGLDGQPRTPVLFTLDASCYVSDPDLDFALVAVKGERASVAQFGYHRMIATQGKILIGECVSIVQHPGGERKQVALRENQLLALLPNFLHYETDTKPGSSGSLVANDQWEIVALHHASVPKTDGSSVDGYVNEGVRISRIVEFLRAANLNPRMRQHVREALAHSEAIAPLPISNRSQKPTSKAPDVQTTGQSTRDAVQITINIGSAGEGVTISAPVASSGPALSSDADPALETESTDPDYTTRHGYAADFLSVSVPLPKLSPSLVPDAALNRWGGGKTPHELPYHHFSVVMNARRRMAFFTAVNIDGNDAVEYNRGDDRWIYDPRIDRSEQVGNELYKNNDLDRGHLVRRLDPVWGDIAIDANDDTFHYTNCAPQHADLNQNDETWQGLENYILDNAIAEGLRVTVFTGPVFKQRDPLYRNVRLPIQFWKVVAMVAKGKGLWTTGYLLSQKALLRDIQDQEVALEAFKYGKYRTFQVPISKIQELTRIDFGDLGNHDPLAGVEMESTAMLPLMSPADAVWPQRK